ncbi:MAG: prepilin-type N-terminal cleavage/methylation domain-containing protein [Acidimicrobiales bacterium]
MRRRRPARSDAGLTLVETMISLAILSVAVALMVAVLVSVQGVVNRTSDRSTSNDQARAALQQLDRQVRSGNVFYDPTDGGMNIRIYTQVNAPTAGGARCMQWQVDGTELQTRSWEDAAGSPVGGTVTPWATVASGVVNRQAPPTPAFALTTPGRLLRITLRVNESARSGRTVELNASVNGRNTQYGFPQVACSTVP